jgi:hypothetical protein
MRLAEFIPRMIVTMTLFSVAWALRAQDPSSHQADTTQAKAPAAMPQLEDVEQRLGPFSFGGQSFDVVLHEKHLAGVHDPRFAQTLATLEVCDATGAVLYQKTFPYEVEGEKFQQSVTGSARLLTGKYFTALLLSYRIQPASGDGSEAWQVFGYQDGRFKPQDAGFRIFDKPLRTDYPMGHPTAEMIVKTPNGWVTKPMVPEGESFDFRVWAGSFYVIVPVTVNFARAKLAPEIRCIGMGGAKGGLGRHEIGCDMRFEAERKPLDSEMTFLRLLSRGYEPGQPAFGEALHLVLDKNSKVEILKANALIDWGVSGDLMQIKFRDLWLKVRIDGDDQKEGWIQTDEDFAAIGLPSRSPEP